MAKADFCFTFYDGDAARDMSHMNRLERGGYIDIILSQRKFGHLTLDQIKKILGRDFDEIFPSIELILDKIEDKFHLEWLTNSIAKMKANSKKQRENVRNRYQDDTNGENGSELVLPKERTVLPLEDGNENGVEDVIKYLNETVKKSFRSKTKSTVAAIHARFSDGYNLEDFKLVISDRHKKWGNDPKMKEHLTPDTLFRPSNFEKYLLSAKESQPKPRAVESTYYENRTDLNP